MTTEATAFAGWCPLVVDDHVCLDDGRSGVISSIRTIQELSGPEDARVQKVWFEILFIGGMSWIPARKVMKQAWLDENGVGHSRDIDWDHPSFDPKMARWRPGG